VFIARAARSAVNRTPEGPAAEAFRNLRASLSLLGPEAERKIFLFTSALPNEGKSFTSANYSLSLAQQGHRVLLIDGDLRRPSLHELFEAAVQPGFSEVLLAEVEWADAVIETPVENLSIMPSGQWDREVLLALSRGGLQGVLEKLAEEFDFLIIDSHPVLAATDALLLGRHADAVILSVLREVSQMPKVYAAAQKLQAVGIRVMGAVVNASDPEEVFTALAAQGEGALPRRAFSSCFAGSPPGRPRSPWLLPDWFTDSGPIAGSSRMPSRRRSSSWTPCRPTSATGRAIPSRSSPGRPVLA